MSFSKARIQRFNELTSEAPPPGAYDPKFDVKVKGPVIQKTSNRFNDAKSTSSGTECSASVSSRSTVSSKHFRTPQVPKKKVTSKANGTNGSKTKTKSHGESKDQPAVYEPTQELADLKVECTNKDKTIHEYEKVIEEMKVEIRDLNEKYNSLQDKYSLSEQQHQKEIESMFQLPCALLGQEVEIGIEDDNDETIKAEIAIIEDDLNSQKEQGELIDKMEKLEIASKELDKMTKELNEALNVKDLQMADLLKLQTQTEKKLENVEAELKKSEKQVADLQADLESVNSQKDSEITSINQKLLEDLTSVLQRYLDFDNSSGQLNLENISFHPDVEKFLNKIQRFITDLKIHYEREMELSRDNFNEERENLEQELEMKRMLVTNLENKLSEADATNYFLTEELKDVQNLYKEMSRNVQELRVELEVANEKYVEALKSHKVELELAKKLHFDEQNNLKNMLEETRTKYLKELDNISSARSKELLKVTKAMEKRIDDEKKRMQDCANKMIENAEAITRETLSACRAESEERIKRVISETDAKMSLLKKTCEEKLRSATENYNHSLERLEKEKTTLNSDLAQRDLEIIQLNAALEEMKQTVETQESFSQSLQDELDRVEAELVEKKEDLRNLKDQIRSESSEMVARKRRLEVVMAENQASVAALSRRLAQSEAEVERLQQELQSKESSLSGCHNLLENITHKSKTVQEQLDEITDKIDEKFELINQIEVMCVNDINDAKTTFSNKIDNLKSITINELKKVEQECKLKTEQNLELKKSLKQMSDSLSEATNVLLKLEEMNDEQSIEMSKMQLKISKLQQQLDEKNTIIKENKVASEMELKQYKIEIDELKDQISKLKTELKELLAKNDELEGKKYDYEEMKLKYNDRLTILNTNLDNERTHREKLEQQVKKCEKTIQHLTEECKQVTDKYAEVIGHHNNKQRIKHISQLKEKINVQQIDLLRLRQELDSKDNVIDELRQTNEKLRLDERRFVGLGKENLHVSSPHKSLFPKSANTTPVSSPHKPLTPLRDRNE